MINLKLTINDIKEINESSLCFTIPTTNLFVIESIIANVTTLSHIDMSQLRALLTSVAIVSK